MSRADNKTLICSTCGMGEALLPKGILKLKFDKTLKLPKLERLT